MGKVLPITQIRIKWSRSYNLMNVFDREICHTGTGIYCISLVSNVPEIVLYVGITDDSFYARLSEHNKKWIHRYIGIPKVRFGIIQTPTEYSRQLVEEVEGGLIYQLQPVININKKYKSTHSNRYLIKNIGNCGLIPEIINMEEHKIALQGKKPFKSGWHNPDR